MIRTRNFLLYVLSLVFLVSAIGYTVVNDTAALTYHVPEKIAFVPNDAAAYGAIAADQSENRDAYIEAMRQKIAQGLGVIEGAPVSFTSVDDIVADAGIQSRPGNAVLWCDVPTRTDDVAAAWFQGPVALLDRGTVRAAVQTLPSADASSVTRDLILLPKQVARASADTCLPSDIIGVGIDGTLIANHETWRFASYGSGMIVGYALDGFPIITGAADESQLDMCGGMDAGDGYAYRLRPGTEFILSCFAGTPAQFIR